MAISPLGLGFLFTAKDLASGTMDRVNGKLKGLGKQSDVVSARMKSGFGIAAASIVPLAAGGAALAGAFSLANFAAPFQEGVARVGNIAGSTAGELRQLRDAAIEAGLRTQFSPNQAVDGLGALAAQGFNTTQSIGLLNESLNLAAGGQIGIEDATKSAAAAIRVFNEESTEQRSIADRLLKVTNMTALQAGDLTLALGTVSKGAGLTKQGMDEMLISMGLVRNAGLDVSVAASSVSSALQFMAKNAKGFKDLGVEVTDTEGNFRNFLDIVSEANEALTSKFPNAADRSASAMKLFGRFGIAAFQNISNQAQAMVGKVPGVNTMTDAINHLRAQMGKAGGTAQEFADNLLNTFGGQSKILGGAVETLGTVIGESFAQVLKPVVKIVAEAVSSMARAWNSLPDGVKTAIAAFVVISGVILTLAGIIGVVTGLGIAAGTVFTAIGGVIAAGAPIVLGLVAAVTALIGVFELFGEVSDRNLGGFGDMLSGTFDNVKLIFGSLTDLFTKGKLTGPLAEQFLQAGTSTQNFIKTVFRAGSRLMEFFGGIRDGFSGVLDTMGPSFAALSGAFMALGEALGFIQPAMGDMKDFGSTGESVGKRIGEVFRVVVDIFSSVVLTVARVVRVMRGWYDFIGTLLAPVFWIITKIIQGLLWLLGQLFDFLVAGIGALAATANTIIQVFATMVDVIMAAMQTIADFAAGLVGEALQLLPEALRPKGSEKLLDKAASNAGERKEQQVRLAAITGQQIAAPTTSGLSAVPLAAREKVSPESQAILEELRAARAEAAADRERERSRELKVVMDGEKVGAVVDGSNRKNAASAFVPVSAGV